MNHWSITQGDLGPMTTSDITTSALQMEERRNGILAAAATILHNSNKTPEEAIKALVWTRRSGKHHRFWIHCVNSMVGKTEA